MLMQGKGVFSRVNKLRQITETEGRESYSSRSILTAQSGASGSGHLTQPVATFTQLEALDDTVRAKPSTNARFEFNVFDCATGYKTEAILAAAQHQLQNSVAPSTIADEGTLTVTVGGSVSGVIDVDGDIDYITVTLTAGQTYSISMRGTGATPLVDPFLQVFATDGSTLIGTDDDGGNGVNSLYTFAATATGTYTIAVSGFADDRDLTGGYTVDVREAGVDESTSRTNAVAIGQGTTFGFFQTADLSNTSNTPGDFYSVTLTAGKYYTFELAAGATSEASMSGREVDTRLLIRNVNGTIVASNDDIAYPNEVSSSLGFYATTSGVYYIQANGYTVAAADQPVGYTIDFHEVDLATLNPLDAIDWKTAENVPTTDVGGVPTFYVYFGHDGENFGQTADDGTSPMVTFDWNDYEKQQVMAAFAEYTRILGYNYEITTDSSQAQFRLLKAQSTQYGAYATPRDPQFGEENWGVVVFNIDSGDWVRNVDGIQPALQQGGYSFNTMLHEFGHAHGLAHPHDRGGGSDVMVGVTSSSSYGIFNLNQGVYTVMSYNDAWDSNPAGPSPFTAAGAGNGWTGTLSAFDIAMLQQRYNVAPTSETGDTVWELPTVQQTGTYYETIYDTGGNDTISYSGADAATIDLMAATLDYSATGGGVLSYVNNGAAAGIWGGFTIANGVVIENATGGSGIDTLLGNSTANALTGNGGADILMGRGGDDLLIGGEGADTAWFNGPQADYSLGLSFNEDGTLSLTVTDNNAANGDEGTDTLDGVESIHYTDMTIALGSGAVALLDSSGNFVSFYATIQAAVDASSDGYTIMAGAGTYDEDVNVNKDVTILGANNGIAGSEVRGNETSIRSITASVAGVTIDGVTITGTSNLGGFDAGIYVTGNDFSLVNSVLAGPDLGGNSFAIMTGGVTGLDIGHNLITGYAVGAYVSGGASTGSVHDNVFQGDGGASTGLGNGVNSETSHVTITNNVFDGLYAGVLNLFPFGPNPADLNTYVSGNTFTNNVAVRPIQVYATPSSTTIYGTDENEAFNGDISGVPSTTALSFDGRGGVDHIYGWDGNDTFWGGAGDDVIESGLGRDYLDGGTGADTMTGGKGPDTYVVDQQGDVVVEVAAQGFDTLLAQASYVLAAGVSIEAMATLNPAGTEAINLTGNELAQSISGNAGNNRLEGGGGNDSLFGNEGRDYLDGGTGDDYMYGGIGGDTYVVDSQGDTVLEYNNQGFDTLLAKTSYVLAADMGIDIMGTFNPAGTEAINLTGNNLNQSVSGNAGDNRLEGGGGNDALYGNDGNDYMDGGTGADYMYGGMGDDTYVIDDAGDTFLEYNGQGNDTLLTKISYVLAADMGIDTLATFDAAGTTALNLTGNNLAQTITGNAGDNTLTGGGGNDAINGGAGTDIAVFAGLRSSYTITVAGGVVTVVDNDAAADGNDGTDTLTGIETLQFKDSSVNVSSLPTASPLTTMSAGTSSIGQEIVGKEAVVDAGLSGTPSSSLAPMDIRQWMALSDHSNIFDNLDDVSVGGLSGDMTQRGMTPSLTSDIPVDLGAAGGVLDTRLAIMFQDMASFGSMTGEAGRLEDRKYAQPPTTDWFA